jgi:hypothetical protein
MNTDTMLAYAVGGWLSASVLVLTCVAPRMPAAPPSMSIEAVDRLLEHSRAATAVLAGIARAASADVADLLAEARCESGRSRGLLAAVLAEFGPESDVGRSATSTLASLQAAVDALELALLRDDGRVARRPWMVVDPPLAAVRLAQDRLMADVWRTMERRRGAVEPAAPIPRSRPRTG